MPNHKTTLKPAPDPFGESASTELLERRLAQLERRVAAERTAAQEWREIASDAVGAMRPLEMIGETKTAKRDDQISAAPLIKAGHAFCRITLPMSMVSRVREVLDRYSDHSFTEQHRDTREQAEDQATPARAASGRRGRPRSTIAEHPRAERIA